MWSLSFFIIRINLYDSSKVAFFTPSTWTFKNQDLPSWELGAGGKPSTWFPPGKLVELYISRITKRPMETEGDRGKPKETERDHGKNEENRRRSKETTEEDRRTLKAID